jgi:TctA family transporter
VVLGPIFEKYLVRALRLSEGDPLILFSSTTGNVLWAMLALSLLFPVVRAWFAKRKVPAPA